MSTSLRAAHITASRRRSTTALTVVSLAAAAVMAAPPWPAARAADAPVTSAFSENAAQTAARAQGVRVEVESQRSETDQVFANPDGSFTREQYLEPVRVRHGSQWVPVDSTLARSADGSWSPAASSVQISFSGGGTGPAVTMDHRNVRLQLTWPQALPAPVIDANTATYREVYPGVDLQLSTVGTSFTQYLVVKSRAAAQDPRVRTLTLGAKAIGGSLAQSGTGYQVTDRTGAVVLRGAQPVMWDSKASASGASATQSLTGSTGTTAADVSLEDGDRQAPMGLSVGAGSVTVKANTTLLDDPAAVFPLVLDPTTSPAIYNWAMVNKTYPTTSYYNFTDADQGVGYNNFSGVHTKRVFFSFPTSSYIGKSVTSATLRAFETYSATCAAGTVNAYLSNDFSSGMTWNTQPSKIAGVLDGWSVKAGRSDCYPGGKTADWTVTTGVKNRVSAKASRSTFVLQGASETTISSWMRFAGPKNTTSSYRPSLSVTYNSYPTTPTAATMWVPTTATACATTAPGPSLNPKVGAAEAMYAKIADPDGGNVSSTFTVQTAAGSAVSTTAKAAVASGSTVNVPVASTLGDGGYRFKVTVSDGSLTATGPYCYFTVDTKAPTQPTVTNTTWTAGVLAPNTATTGTFTMTATGATSIYYRWSSSATWTKGTPNTSGQVSAAATASSTLDVWEAYAADTAGNTSAPTSFIVKRTQPGKLAEYLFNGRIPDPAAPAVCNLAVAVEATCDSANTQVDSNTPLTDPNAAAAYKFDLPADLGNFDVGRYDTGADNHAIVFDGAGTGTGTSGPPVVAQNSFAIAGWVLLGDGTQSRTLVAQDRDINPADPNAAAIAYDLGYDQASDKFTARVMSSSGAVLAQAIDALPAYIGGVPANGPLSKVGDWVYLAMVYDSVAGTLRLDSAAAANTDPPGSNQFTWTPGTAVAVPGAVAAGLGAFHLGAGSSVAGNRTEWVGPIDNLAVWQGLPTSVTLQSNATQPR